MDKLHESASRPERVPQALVTGATGGIGRAFVRRLLDVGHDVLMSGRDGDRLESLARSLAGSGSMDRRVRWVTADLENPSSGAAIVEALDGPLDVVIHAAGAFSSEPASTLSVEQLTRMSRLNYLAPADLTLRCLPALRVAVGQVVFMNSSAISRAIPGLAAYSASKHALKGFADSLRADVNDAGIRVMTVVLGRVATTMQRQIALDTGSTFDPRLMLQPDDVARLTVDALQLDDGAELTDLHLRPARGPRAPTTRVRSRRALAEP